ncbi:CII family transcriptional regulator [Lonsdalea quercina]|uniref:CII family transcriptional regulator n=1 Tax=Lonsdalea quercina TaxID=71657 RepID=UPI003975C4D9
MESATPSKTARRIESALLNKLALMGQKAFAAAMGVPEYQVSRWKNGFFSQVSLMLAVLNYGVADDEMAELAKRLAGYLEKEKRPAATERSEQFSIDF